MDIKLNQASQEYIDSLKVGDEVIIITMYYGEVTEITYDKIKTITSKKKDIKTVKNYHLNFNGNSYYQRYGMRGEYIVEPTEENIDSINKFKLYVKVKNKFNTSMIDDMTVEQIERLNKIILELEGE